MKTKISMKTIYLILVISIGLIGLGIGSTYAVFTASAEISNPISFSSNLSYKADIFDTADITIGPNSSKNVNFAIWNDEQIEGINYATWYIYEGNDDDISFNSGDEDQSAGPPSGQYGDVTVFLTVTNNTSNTITLTMGVATSKDEIVLPSYMKLVTITAPSTYTLNLNKGTGVSTIYYKINGASSYTSSTSNISLSVNSGSTYYYYGVASSGYTMSSCTSSSPCSGTMGTSAVTKTLSASVNSYTLNLNKGTGVSRIYYKINGASSYTSSTSNKSLSVKYNTTYYYYGVASSGYTMSSCTSSNPCSGTMGTGTVTKTLSATATSSGPFTVEIYVDGGGAYTDTATVAAGESYTTQFATMTDSITVSCTNDQVAYWGINSNNIATFTINSVTADTVCNVEWDY